MANKAALGERIGAPSGFSERRHRRVTDSWTTLSISASQGKRTRSQDFNAGSCGRTSSAYQLPTRCQQVLTLTKVYGMTEREVAERLGISEHTVRTHVVRGIERCADYFRERGITRP